MINYEVLLQCVLKSVVILSPIFVIYFLYKLTIFYIIRKTMQCFLSEVDYLFYKYLSENPADDILYYLWDRKSAMKDKTILLVTPNKYFEDYIATFKNDEEELFHVISKKTVIKDLKREGIDIKKMQQLIGNVDG